MEDDRAADDEVISIGSGSPEQPGLEPPGTSPEAMDIDPQGNQ